MKPSRQPAALFIFIMVLFAFLSLTALLVAHQQRSLLRTSVFARASYDLDLMADASLEALLKSDYMTVRTLVSRWGGSHHDILAIRIVAQNGFALAEFHADTQGAADNYQLTKEVIAGKTKLATIQLTGDYREAENIAIQLRNRLILAAVLITTLLGAALWFTFRKMALAPLERMVEERTRALSTANLELTQKIAERAKAEEAMRNSQNLLQAIIDNEPDCVKMLDAQGNLIMMNRAGLEMIGVDTLDQVKGQNVFPLVTQESLQPFTDMIANVFAGQSVNLIFEIIGAQGRHLWLETRAVPFRDDKNEIIALLGITRDITERKRLEQQLLQSQKMESIGTLAGGVAHDFNNMLSVIIGHTELAMQQQMNQAQPLHDSLTEIHKAALRSADLTRQLLAFARKQTVVPKVLDLNETVTGILKMLQRLMGENIQLNWQPAGDLWPVRIDPSQIDQILANLCVNARDAIADVGKLSIATANCTFDAKYCAAHVDLVPGDYVRLTVSDTGRGMDKETLNHIFEPFFTTKGVGKGTGLGLATVYGAVKQNNGFINVYSEPEQGTTFTIYLPRFMGQTEVAQPDGGAGMGLRGQETILLVEDEAAILAMTTRMLTGLGYTVLAASTPGEATRLAREHAGEIDLLMTDVVMPEMNGLELAKTLSPLYPGLKRLFMSGFTAEVIAYRGMLEEGMNFIQKPFSINNLASKVREVLKQGKENEVVSQ